MSSLKNLLNDSLKTLTEDLRGLKSQLCFFFFGEAYTCWNVWWCKYDESEKPFTWLSKAAVRWYTWVEMSAFVFPTNTVQNPMPDNTNVSLNAVQSENNSSQPNCSASTNLSTAASDLCIINSGTTVAKDLHEVKCLLSLPSLRGR